MTPEEKRELVALDEEKKRRAAARGRAEAVASFLATDHTRDDANAFYATMRGDNDAEKALCKGDLFFLLTVACGRKDIDRDWLFARCREVQSSPDGHLDLWARDHYKSTIITFGQTIRDILNDPEVTVGIHSHTRPTAKAFLEQIKREFENNAYLKERFPDILYAEPAKDADKWSLDGGIIVKRKSNPKEATIEAWGLVDGQPTGKHFKIQVYDDVVTLESITTPEQIAKTTMSWAMSLNLGSGEHTRRRYIGTRYHINDTYREIISRGSAVPRIHTATESGQYPGTPVLMSTTLLEQKRRDMGPYIFGTQMLQNPIADNAMSFKADWLKYYEKLGDTARWNRYLLVDPASQKKATSDYTVMLVIGLAPDNNYYLLDGIRDRLNLTQRASKLFELHRQWTPKEVGYERYGMQADVEHMQYVMEKENYRFNIVELGGAMPKSDRIRQLVPVFEGKRIYLPKRLTFVDYESRTVDLVRSFIDDEYLPFPVAVHDDMLDCLARIVDPMLGAKFPKAVAPTPQPQYSGLMSGGAGWMG